MPTIPSNSVFAVLKVAFALGLGALGALLFQWMTLPLPWMLGPMCICTIAALARMPIGSPIRIRPPFIMILGIMLGSAFRPEMIDLLDQWIISLALLTLYAAVIAALIYPYYRRIAGYDRMTAYFCAMPGGFNEMVLIGGQLGGDDRRIALAHAARVLLVVFGVSLWFRFFMDLDPQVRAGAGVSIVGMPPLEILILLACGVIGWPLARLARLPTPQLIGPMLASGIAHLTGLTAAPPPSEIVNLAQLVIGTAIGCRFLGIATTVILRSLGIGAGATVAMLTITAVFSVVVEALTGTPFASVVLAYSPGGLAEMSLVALALGVDVAYVAVHHVFRIFMVVLCAPIFGRSVMKPPASD